MRASPCDHLASPACRRSRVARSQPPPSLILPFYHSILASLPRHEHPPRMRFVSTVTVTTSLLLFGIGEGCKNRKIFLDVCFTISFACNPLHVVKTLGLRQRGISFQLSSCKCKIYIYIYIYIYVCVYVYIHTWKLVAAILIVAQTIGNDRSLCLY